MKEEVIQQQVANYLRSQYPDVLFHSDFGSGVKLTMGQAVKQKRLNGGRRAWPDVFIAEPKTEEHFGKLIRDYEEIHYCGLFLELKREGVRIRKKNGEWASEHIAEQAIILEMLRARGYRAEFARGFEEAKGLIDDYLRARRW